MLLTLSCPSFGRLFDSETEIHEKCFLLAYDLIHHDGYGYSLGLIFDVFHLPLYRVAYTC